MYKIIPWSEQLDLSEFYSIAKAKGFENNASQKMLIDSVAKEKEWCVWILYYNDRAVGSVAAHSFDEMGPNSYRVAARTCVFTDLLPLNSLRTINQIITHQHATSQFLIPACIEWVGQDKNLYITTNENDVGTQKLVHRIFAPAMVKSGQMEKIKDMNYRGSMQTIWKLNPIKFYEELNKYSRWK
jgi:hypothetical protein